MKTAVFKIWRGDAAHGKFREYTAEVAEGMVVLDAVHQIQATQAPDLACRWNCKAGKCGSCSAEVNGMPKLMCMTRLSELPLEKPVTIEPMKAFAVVKDLVTDVSWNFRVKKKIKPFRPRPPDAPDGTWRMQQQDIDASNVFFVRTFVTCYATTRCMINSSGRVSSFTSPHWRCIRSTRKIASKNCETRRASAIATSRNAAPRFARKTFRLRITALFP